MFLNERKFALFTNIRKQPTILLLHGPANRHGYDGIGIWLPQTFFVWWKRQCVSGNLLNLAAQCKRTDSRYTLSYPRMITVGIKRGLRSGIKHVMIPLTAFIHSKAPYVKAPRLKKQ